MLPTEGEIEKPATEKLGKIRKVASRGTDLSPHVVLTLTRLVALTNRGMDMKKFYELGMEENFLNKS